MAFRNVVTIVAVVVAMLGSLLGGLAVPAQAQVNPPFWYDDFSSKELDPLKWFGLQATTGIFAGAPLEITREIRGGHGELAGKLVLGHRAVGGQTGTALLDSRNRLNFRLLPFQPAFVGQVPNFAGVEFDVLPTSFKTAGCPNPTAGPTRARAGFNTSLFNDPAVVGPGNSGNVNALVELRRSAAFGDPPDVIRAFGFVSRCHDAACAAFPPSITVPIDLGPVLKDEPVRLKLRWEPDLNGVTFQKNDEAPHFVSYAEAPFDVDPSLDEFANPPKPGPFRALEAVVQVPVCAEQPTEAEITALFDTVVVLPLQ